MSSISTISKFVVPKRRFIRFLTGATVILSLLGMGGLWVASMIPTDTPQVIRANDSPVFVADNIPRQASVPWRRQIESPSSVSVATARIPWVRSDLEPIVLPQAIYPWKQPSNSRKSLTIATAQVPWVRPSILLQTDVPKTFSHSRRQVAISTAQVPWKKNK